MQLKLTYVKDMLNKYLPSWDSATFRSVRVALYVVASFAAAGLTDPTVSSLVSSDPRVMQVVVVLSAVLALVTNLLNPNVRNYK